ncbi:GntR family transcriptional regulator [Terrihabitans sp. B22-R8]|uniref:GntR family transcriptional regulator n=1 Tax=Terrihabitans sp. B22-R8 TaxID=3425128 RepID=UPI00403D3650
MSKALEGRVRMRLTVEEQKLIGTPLSRKDAVLQLLKAAIIDGRLPPGEKLDQNEIAAQLGVSRMPVREALKQLEAEGFVTVYPYRGVEVSRLEPAEIVEMFGIRIALETLAVGRAVSGLKASHLSRMRKILSTMDGLVADPGEGDPWMGLNHEFHSIVNEASGWPRLVESIDQFRGNVERYVRCYLAFRGREQSQCEHWELLQACEKRDPAAAQDVIRRHLDNTANALVAALASSSETAPRHPVPAE